MRKLLVLLLVSLAGAPAQAVLKRAVPIPQRFASPAAAPAAAPAPALPEALPAQLDALVKSELEKTPMPNAAFGIVKDGRLVWSAFAGTRTPGTEGAPTAQTVFRIGSITKIFTGLALLKLRDDGRLNLDDPAELYLPELARVIYPTRDSPLITLRHLVTHTSGLPRVGTIDYTKTDRDLPEADVLKSLDGLKLSYVPGTRISYSNLAMGLAGLVVGRVSKQSFRDYTTEKLLKPLGMTRSYWDQSAVPAELLAMGHHKEGDAFKPVPASWRLGAVESAGGLWSTLEDMARFAAFELSAWPPGDAPDGGPVRRASVRESQVPAGFGFGEKALFGVNWGVVDFEGGLMVAHTGSTLDHSADIKLALSRGFGVVALTGCGESEALAGLSGKLLRAFAAHFPKPQPTLPPEMEAAVAKVLALAAKPELAEVEKSFAPVVLRALAAPKLLEVFQGVQATGACSRKHVERLDGRAATVRVRCGEKDLDFTVSTEAAAPHLIDGLFIKPVK